MTLIHSMLFLGFAVEKSFTQALKKNNPNFNAYFIQSGETYLEEVYFQDVHYLGKYINNEESLTQLELLEAHIFSLLKKLVPDYDYSSSNLVLFSLSKGNP